MAWQTTANPDRFEEAVAWFVERFPSIVPLLSAWGDRTQQRAFTVAGVIELRILAEIFVSLVTALERGDGLDRWKADVRRGIAAWRTSGHHLETIYRNNVQAAFSAGRWHQLNHPAVVRRRPFLMYDAVLDGQTSDICRPLNNTVRHRDDTFWAAHHPPLHHRCRSAIRALTPRQAERRGITTLGELSQLPAPQEGFGALPTFDDVRPDRTKYPRDLLAIYDRRARRRRRAGGEPDSNEG